MSWKDLKKDLINSEYCYFYTDRGVLLNGDCLKIMERFPKESIDLVLTDPPYNIARKNLLTKKGAEIQSTEQAWGNDFKDSWKSFDDYYQWLKRIFVVIKGLVFEEGSLIVFLNRNFTGYFVINFKKELNLIFRNKIYFEKINPVPHVRKRNYLSCIEEAIWFSKNNKYYINFISQKEMKQIFKGSIGKKCSNHPTEKYEWMIKPLIIRHSKENDIVLDPFLGSGTTAVACEKLNRRWIGIEINPEYCEIAKCRIMETVKQRRLI